MIFVVKYTTYLIEILLKKLNNFRELALNHTIRKVWRKMDEAGTLSLRNNVL